MNLAALLISWYVVAVSYYFMILFEMDLPNWVTLMKYTPDGKVEISRLPSLKSWNSMALIPIRL